MVEAEFFLELLVSLLAEPARLDRGRERFDIDVGGEVGQIVFLLADEPNLVTPHVVYAPVADPLRRPVGDAHGSGSETGLSGSLRSLAPGERAPFRLRQHVFGCDGQDVGHMPFAGPAAYGEGQDEFNVAR